MADDYEGRLEVLRDYLAAGRAAVFFGGAGVSTESGIPDFRSARGLYSQRINAELTPEQLVSRSCYERYPEIFFEFYREKLIYPAAKPNKAHIALAELERRGVLRAVVTQNIDGLHQAAGSERVLELHGSSKRNYCERCHAFYTEDFILGSRGVPVCTDCGGRVKPDVVLYEESLGGEVLRKSIEVIGEADLLLIGGTSLVVYPAAGLIRYYRGEHIVLINKTATSAEKYADLVFHEPVGQVLGEAVGV